MLNRRGFLGRVIAAIASALCWPSLAPTATEERPKEYFFEYGIDKRFKVVRHVELWQVGSDGRTTRIIEGQVEVNKAYRHLGIDEWLRWVTPMIPKDFRRVSKDYRLDLLGLKVDFRFVDEEVT